MNTLRIIPVLPAPNQSPQPAAMASLAMVAGVPLAPARRPGRRLAVVVAATVTFAFLLMALFVGSAFTAFKKSEAYQASLNFIRNDSRAVAVLGEPIQDGLIARGSIQRSGAFGKAEMVIELSGPRAHGSAQILSHRDGVRWVVDAARLVVDDRVETLTP